MKNANIIASLYAVLFKEDGTATVYDRPFGSDMEFEGFYEALPLTQSARLFASKKEAEDFVATVA